MNPDDAATKEARSIAAETLTKLPSLESVPKKALSEQQKIQQHILESRRMLIGWLARGDRGWECRSTTSAPNGELALYVLMRDESAKTIWKRIGTLNVGSFTVTTESPSALLEGRLVFGQSVGTP